MCGIRRVRGGAVETPPFYAVCMSRAYLLNLRLLNLRPHPAPTASQIKAAFRKAALLHHPDLPSGCAQRFLEIQQAHDELLQQQPFSQDSQRSPSGRPHTHHSWKSHEPETPEEAAARREYEEILRRAKFDREQDLREDTEAESERKWSYFRLVAGIVGVGALIKVAIFQAVSVVRQAAIDDAKQQQLALRTGDDKENSGDGVEELLTVRASVSGRAQR